MNHLIKVASAACLWILFLGSSVFGQQLNYKITGKVVEESNNEPLSGVAIVESANGQGVITNANGEFVFEIKSFPIQLFVKYLGYFDDTLSISNQEQFKKYFEGKPVLIILRQNPFLINEVVITPAGSAIQMFKEEPYAIMDYVIDGNRFFALGYRNSNPLKPEIFIGNPFGRLLFSKPLPTAGGIYQDCQGKVYAVARDSVYQLNNLEDTLSISPVCDDNFFQTRVKPIVALHDPYYIYFDKSKNGQYHDYYIGNYKTKKSQLFYRVGDEKHEQGFISIDKQLRQEFIGEFAQSDFISGALREMHARQASLRNRINTDYRPVHSTLFQSGDTALLFDFDLQVINCITISGVLRWRTKMQVDLTKEFTGKVHKDKITNRFFLEFLNIQSSYLIEIDPYTGKVLSNIPIRQYKHIDHISVYDNRIFFLFQPDFGDRGKKLYYVNL
jgi:hypothetical protein